MMKELPTWSGKSKFKYSGSVALGTQIYYGKKWSTFVSAAHYQALLNHFHGREVDIGTSRDAAPHDSVGEWIQHHLTKTAIASYVGPILLNEGNAVRGLTPSKIRIE